jgi:hypothetical protein
MPRMVEVPEIGAWYLPADRFRETCQVRPLGQPFAYFRGMLAHDIHAAHKVKSPHFGELCLTQKLALEGYENDTLCLTQRVCDSWIEGGQIFHVYEYLAAKRQCPRPRYKLERLAKPIRKYSRILDLPQVA